VDGDFEKMGMGMGMTNGDGGKYGIGKNQKTEMRTEMGMWNGDLRPRYSPNVHQNERKHTEVNVQGGP